jgi:hypothetical protein
MVWGNKPVDGGNLLLTPAERMEMIKLNPKAEKFIRLNFHQSAKKIQ